MVHEPFSDDQKVCPKCGSSNIDIEGENHICCFDCGNLS